MLPPRLMTPSFAVPPSPSVLSSALLAVAELDGEPIPAAAMARCIAANPGTIRTALRRFRSYLGELQPEFARRSFAAYGNPRLGEAEQQSPPPRRGASVIEFPVHT